MAGFCCGIAVGVVLLAAVIAVGGHVLLELADGRLAAF
jgi:hypothetical protein